MSYRTYTAVAALLSLACAGFAANAPKDRGPMSVVVRITPADHPMQMEALKPLLATDAADRLNPRPAGLTDEAYFNIVVGGQYDKLNGFWPFRLPLGTPAAVTKADYFACITNYPGLKYYEDRYGRAPAKVDGNAYESVPAFVAAYKVTGDRRYLDMTRLAVESMGLSALDEIEKNPTNPASIGQYWVSQYAYMYIALQAIKDTPEFKPMMARFGECLGKRANAWPLYPQRNGTNLGPLCPGFWYDLALEYSPTPIPRAAELKAYADTIWNDWARYHDSDEDDPNYTMGDLIVCHAWCLLRGEPWWKSKAASRMWLDYAEQVANDGSWPAYGDGGNIGRYGTAVFAAELAAAASHDGRYKWLAHRAFWNGKDRFRQLCAGIGYTHQEYLALAYLIADETVKEVPPSAGVTLTERHWRDLTSWAVRLSPTGGYWFVMQDKLAPSKLIFRGGPKETDDSLLMQVAQQGGHGHMDAGALSHYCGDFADYLDYATLRLDLYMEAHNIFTLRDPAIDKPWPGRWNALCTTEDVQVPVTGSSAEASYARVHIGEYPGTTTTSNSWKTIREWKNPWTLEKAIGYKNWPMRLDRSVLFINNRCVVVRDLTEWLTPASAEMGPNWTFAELGSAGPNWVYVWMPKILNGHYGSLVEREGRLTRLAPVETAARDLLIWYAPKQGGVLTIEKLLRERSELDCYVPANSDLNMPLRAWYTQKGEWTPEHRQAFTSVLMPHAPQADAAALAAGMTVLQDTPEATALRIAADDAVYTVVMTTPGKTATVGALTTDAEAVLIAQTKGKPGRISAWHATALTYEGKELLKSRRPRDLSREIK